MENVKKFNKSGNLADHKNLLSVPLKKPLKKEFLHPRLPNKSPEVKLLSKQTRCLNNFV